MRYPPNLEVDRKENNRRRVQRRIADRVLEQPRARKLRYTSDKPTRLVRLSLKGKAQERPKRPKDQLVAEKQI